MMERAEILATMADLKLYGMRGKRRLRPIGCLGFAAPAEERVSF